MLALLPFQRRFVAGAFAAGADTAALSLPRGNGKSTLAAHLAWRALTPGDPLHVPGAENLLLAASITQATRSVFAPVRRWLDGNPDYRFAESANRASITHKPSRTVVRVVGSSGKSAMGLVGVPLVIADEPGSWETTGGTLMYDALVTAQGKPDSPLRCIFIGTVSPATRGWWPALIAKGSTGSVYVQALQGDAEKWDDWQEIRRVNPLMSLYPDSRAKLREELREAQSDSRLRARFCSYRLNRPMGDESEMLLTTDDWQRTLKRPVPERSGRPVVGIDLGGGRAWSAAVALWQNGRCEALAVAPGVPSIADQEKRDRVPPTTYSALIGQGGLRLASGLRVQPPAMLWEAVLATWAAPELVICDRFRLNELRDAIGNACRVEPRVSRWSEAASDIRAVRAMAKDGPLSVHENSRALLTASLAAAMIANDDQGSSRLIKRDASNNCSRDDAAAALVLACGVWQRASTRPAQRGRYLGAA